jgi:hypothetical protein
MENDKTNKVDDCKNSLGGGVISVLRCSRIMLTIQNYLKKSLPYEPSKKQIFWCYRDFLRFQWKYGGKRL